MAPSISVIIPVYNAERTLTKAVDSVLAQTMPDFELLLVDDGSGDASLALCHALARRDSRVRVIGQANRGICAARNAGLEQARGKYLAFCDDDDVFLPDALYRLLDLAQATGADMVRGGYTLLRQRADGSWAELPHPPGSPCRLAEPTPEYGEFLANSGPQFVWNALYRRTAVEELRFDGRCRSGLEDFVFNAEAYTKVRLAVYDPRPVYRHYEGMTSTSTSHTEQALQERIDALAPWLEAEYRAACRWCGAETLPGVWGARKAAAVTFLLHQLRDMHADAAQRRLAWETLRGLFARYPCRVPPGRGLTAKQRAALWLHLLHLEGLYELLPNKEGSL